jgi:FkbM family methyltransferase
MHARAFIPHVGWLAHEPGDEVISLLRQGYFEAMEQAFVWLYLRPGDCFIDCGAHIGLYSVLASRAMGGKARILSVEANADTARFLEMNLRENGATGASVYRNAVWRESSVIRFVKEEAGRSAFARVSFDASDVAVEVAATTIDRLVEESGAPEVALVKLDVEGAEPEAIEGAAASLGRGALSVLMVEFTEANLQRRGWSTPALGALLAGHRLELCQMSQETLQLAPVSTAEPIWFANLFAVRDLDAVNARLRGADAAHVEVARDILARGAACHRFKELEDLDTVRGQLAQQKLLADSNKTWALNVEALFAKEKELSAELRRWAEDAEARFVAARDRSAQLLARAEEAERRLEETVKTRRR